MIMLKKLIISINLFFCILFLGLFFLGLKEWIFQLFIQQDGKMWLDWQTTFLQVLISLSGALSISMFFLLGIKKSNFLKRFYSITVYILIVSCIVYGLWFIRPQYGDGILTRIYYWHYHIFVPFFISLIAFLFKNYWEYFYVVTHSKALKKNIK
jgi:hypothetical protein